MKLHHSITDLLDKNYSLTYIDYRDNLNGHEKEFSKAIQSQDWSHIDEILEGWNLWEGQEDSIDTILKELTGEICRVFNVDEERAESFIEKYRDYFKDEIYNRDDSTPINDLLRNTDSPVFYYDTGYTVDEQTWNLNEKELNNYIKEIKKTLGIKIKDSTWDKNLMELLANATYGGELLIFFNADLQSLMSIGEYKKVTFKNMEIGLIDYGNGSGHNVTLSGSKVTMPLVLENIHTDKEHRYDYTENVCGMRKSWCDSTGLKFSKR